MEYIIYMDESAKDGPFYGNFYGGALVRSIDLDKVVYLLEEKKRSLNMFKEVKWQRVTPNYLDKYMQLIDAFFDLIAKDTIKLRIMFTHNFLRPIGLTQEQKAEAFTILYYQFLKHAFGLRYSNASQECINLRLYFDILPVTGKEREKFMSYVVGLQHELKSAKINILKENIAEVNSDDHVVLQLMDIVLGAMCFRLNDYHLAKTENGTRGRRTIAKEALYEHIRRHITRIYPRFNIGLTTGSNGDPSNYWAHPYRHWRFESHKREVDYRYAKKKQKN